MLRVYVHPVFLFFACSLRLPNFLDIQDCLGTGMKTTKQTGFWCPRPYQTMNVVCEPCMAQTMMYVNSCCATFVLMDSITRNVGKWFKLSEMGGI